MQFAKTGLATHVRITGCDATRIGNRLSYVPFSGHKGKKKGLTGVRKRFQPLDNLSDGAVEFGRGCLRLIGGPLPRPSRTR